MTQQQKPGPGFFEKTWAEFEQDARLLREGLEKTHDELRAAGAELTRDFKEQVGDPARSTINKVRRTTVETYKDIEDAVGQDRIKGALLGAKLGGSWGARTLHVGPIALGAVFGGAVGLVLGRKFYNWLDAEPGQPANGNEPTPDQPAPSTKPEEKQEAKKPPRKPGAFPVPPET